MSLVHRYFSRRRGLAQFISAGPLAPVIEDLAAALQAKGYSACTIHSYVRAARHVTYAIERHQLARRHRTLAGLRAFAQRCHSPGSWDHPSPGSWGQGETRATGL